MNPSEASLIPFKSKKPHLHSKPPNTNQLSSKTPEKPTKLPRRSSRNRGVALSINEVRRVAESLQDEDRPDPLSHRPKSARRQIESWPTESPTRKPKKPAGGPFKLPGKFEILAEFFDSLDSSIRLLRLKGSTTNFTNICPKIECLTDRRFSYSHLAQLKFILSDAIEIKRVLVFDERTSCMKPDLHISFNIDAIEDNAKLKSESGNMYLRKVFRARLADFSKSHPEVDEIPEEMLPEPFNHSKTKIHSNVREVPTSSFPCRTSIDVLAARQYAVSKTCIHGDEISGVEQDVNSNVKEATNLALSVDISVETLRKQQTAIASHLPQSFRKGFSKKVICSEAENTSPNLLKTSFQHSVLPVPELLLHKSSTKEETVVAGPAPAKVSIDPASNVTFCASSAHFTPSCSPATPSKVLDAMKNGNGYPTEICNIDSTPAKLAYTPVRLMNVTPALQPPKRCYMSPEDDCTGSPQKLVRRPPRSRSLKFDTPEKKNSGDKIDDVGGASVDSEIFDILPENLLQSIREKERITMEEQDPVISLAKRRRKMIASLPKLFNMIHFLFQSTKQSVITKEELIHKIITSQCDIVDRREVEERLSLLLELVPEWISEKLASGGDLLFCINKGSSPESIRARLEESK